MEAKREYAHAVPKFGRCLHIAVKDLGRRHLIWRQTKAVCCDYLAVISQNFSGVAAPDHNGAGFIHHHEYFVGRALSASYQANAQVYNPGPRLQASASKDKKNITHSEKNENRAAPKGGPGACCYTSSSALCSIASGILATDIRVRAIWLRSWSAFSSSASDFDSSATTAL
jgi:hypothetical protein